MSYVEMKAVVTKIEWLFASGGPSYVLTQLPNGKINITAYTSVVRSNMKTYTRLDVIGRG
jgi:hypothetical protein